MGAATRTGRCYCGTVQYALDGELGPLVNCHCRSCRRAHGAAFVTVSAVASAGFRITSGADAVRAYRTAEGFRYFCERCGGRLFNRPQSTDVIVVLVVATLDDEPTGAPSLHVNVGSKAPWYDILDDRPRYDTFPPGGLEALGGRSSGEDGA
jgi:hypothetical protein